MTNPQDTYSKIPGACFFEVAEAPQAAPTRRTGLGGPKNQLKSMKIGKLNENSVRKIQGRVFSEVAEAPHAAPTQTQRAWGPRNRLKSMKIDDNQ